MFGHFGRQDRSPAGVVLFRGSWHQAVHRVSRWLVPALAVGGLCAFLETPVGAQGAPAAPSALSIELYGFKANWWPPLIPGSACFTLTGGVGGGMYMYLPLLWVQGNDKIDYALSLASSIAVNPQDTVFTIHLNPKYDWSNGQPVTAEDVVYFWDLMKAASAPSSPLPYCYAGTGGVPNEWASVVATGPHTVTVRTVKPVNPIWFELNGLAQLIPIPKNVWDHDANLTKELQWIESIGATPTNPVYKVVDGPYELSSFQLNQYYKFVANPRFGGHPPSIRTIIYDYEPSDAAAFAALKTGAVQIGVLPASLWADRSQLHGYRILPAPQFGFAFIALNFSPDAPGIGNLFGRLYIRQALQYGIDQAAIAQYIYHGTAMPTLGPVPAMSTFYDHAVQNPYPYDPAKGEALLAAHGWHKVNGVMTKDGKPLAFQLLLPPGNLALTDETLEIQQAWAQEGIKVTLRQVPRGTALSIEDSEPSKWDAGTDHLWTYIPDYFPTGGDLFVPGGGFNLGHYADPRMTQLVRATYLPGTPAQVRERFAQYEVYALKELPVLYVPTPDVINVVSDRVGGWLRNYNVIQEAAPNWYLYWK